jgi:hypothetical protein
MGFFVNSASQSLSTRPILLSFFAFASAFITYFSKYAFRKPFTSAEYAGERIGRLDHKILAITLQLVGYTLSTFFGIKIISALNRSYRGVCILFSVVHVPEWRSARPHLGVVFSFLEGRRFSGPECRSASS